VGRLARRRHSGAGPGVVDKAVDAAEPFDGLLDEPPAILGL